MSEIANTLNYSKDKVVRPYYKLHKILPQSGSQSVTVNASGQTSTFEIPTNVLNFSKSHLYFDIAIDESATAGHASWFTKDAASIFTRMQVYTRNGVYLCDIPYVNNYTHLVNKPETSFDEFLTYDTAGDDNLESGALRFLRRSNSVSSSSTRTVAAPFAMRPDNTNASVSYTECQYVEPGAVRDGANAGDLDFKVIMPLNHIKNCILSCDKDLYFGEILILRIEYADKNRVFWTAASATNPTTTATAPVSTVDISNLALYLAVEQNPLIISQLVQKVQSGFQMLMPFTYGYLTNLNGTSQNVSLRFNRGHGFRLVKIYHSLYNNTQTINTMYDNDNKADAKCSTYYTMINNSRLQEFNVDTSTYEDFMLHKELIKGSVIQNADMYHYNWFHLDEFSGMDIKDSHKLCNELGGLDLNVEHKWDIYCTTANAQHNHYSFAVCQRMLSIGPNGIEVL